MVGWMDGWMGGRDGGTDGRMAVWMDGCVGDSVGLYKCMDGKPDKACEIPIVHALIYGMPSLCVYACILQVDAC